MKQNEMDQNKAVEEREPYGSLALVLKMPISKMPEYMRLLREVPGVRVVYLRTSAGRLRIVEE